MLIDYNDFANDWEAAWNAHDLDRILSHYADDIVFRSRKAFTYLGVGEVHGKGQLRAYWRAALDAQPDLKFSVQTVCGGHHMVVIVFSNQKGDLAAETLYFRSDGLIHMASGCQKNWRFENPYRLQVDLWIKQGREDAFQAYEQRALANMARYGGELVEVSHPDDGSDERHILAFPTHKAFEAYRSGPEAEAVRAERDSCIAKTEITELRL